MTTTNPPWTSPTAHPRRRRGSGPPGARPAGRASTRRKWYEIIGLTTPAIVVYVMFVLVPMGFALYYSLYRWRGVGPPTEFVGFRNYIVAFEDPHLPQRATQQRHTSSSGRC